ncbi:speckle-type POZ protein-like [Argiope bruennichi]|uniref:TD and POZ domain-containing protein 4 n=1 Tax=Argiope bruennichi TaxID=94029 RepID=A0A8T0EFP2_ARGBR|nr:speckle-type POZ protein-like [Argiope bruennichi]KAF8771527.1 TD and POZ domain-containing protein 4 [Argiope bruennichi]
MARQITDEKNFYSITWAVNNFSYCWQKKNEAIASPIFSLYVPEETRWKLLLFPHGVTVSDGSSLAFYLYRDQDCDGPENIEVEYNLEFIAANGSILTKGETKHKFSKESRWGYPCFQKRKTVFITKRMKFLPQDILTTRCSMKLNRILDQKSIENRNLFARTIINVERKSLLWTIKGFSSFATDQKNGLVIKSASKEILLKIDLFLTGGQSSEEKINLDICPGDRCMNFFTMKTLILVNDEMEEDINAGEFECWCEFGKCSTFTLNVSRNKLMEDEVLYLPNDVLSLRLELATSTGFAFEGVEKVDFGTISHGTSNELLDNWSKCNAEGKKTKNSCALINDLTSLFKDQSLCDVKLQAKANVFPAHTSILGARSPVFKAMFSTNMKEKLNGCVDVSDLDDETVRRFLLYLYTDKIEELEWEAVSQLYKAADKYAIISLKDQCSMLLKDDLNLENACKTLLLSDLHQDEDLKIIAQDFILKNAKEIFKSEEWIVLSDSYSKLALETTLRNWKQES